MKRLLFNFLMVFCFFLGTYAQEYSYTTHTVKAKETLYSLSKQYNVSIDELYEDNPSLELEGLKQGSILRIRSASHQVSLQVPIVHKVQKGETLYGIAKQYGVEVERIKADNPIIEAQGLKEGFLLEIYQQSKQNTLDVSAENLQTMKVSKMVVKQDLEEAFLEITDTLKDTLEHFKRERLNIAFFAPLMLELNDSLCKQNLPIDKKSEVAYDIYAGVLLAIDSLIETGIAVDLQVFDTQNDEKIVEQIIKNDKFKGIDMIVGPLYAKTFKLVSKQANDLGIPIICPVPISKKVLIGAPYTLKAFASKASRHDQMAEFLNANHASSKVFVVDQRGKYKIFANQFVSSFNKKHKSNHLLKEDTAMYLSMWKVDVSRITKNMQPSKRNVVAILSSDNSFVTEVVSNIYMASKDLDVMVLGEEKWQSFKLFDEQYLRHLNVHLTSSYYIDHASFLSKALFDRGANHTKYSDAAYRSVSSLASFLSKHEAKNLTQIEQQDFGKYHFKFLKKGFDAGYENGYTHILKYENYEYLKVR